MDLGKVRKGNSWEVVVINVQSEIEIGEQQLLPPSEFDERRGFINFWTDQIVLCSHNAPQRMKIWNKVVSGISQKKKNNFQALVSVNTAVMET